MISDRRPRRRGPRWVVGLLVALVAVLAALPVSASPLLGAGASRLADASDTVPTRIEGLLKSTAGSTWLVDQTRVEISSRSTIDERRGRAEPGAWVTVWGDIGKDSLVADTLRVLRPKGAGAPVIQFSGVLTKLTAGACVVSDKDVTFAETIAPPTDLPLFSLVRVTGYRGENGVVATELELLARDATGVPVYLEGEVEQVVDSTVVVEGKTVRLKPEDAARVKQRDWVEIKARYAQDFSLAAELFRLVDRSRDVELKGFVTEITGLGEDHQTWTVVTFEDGQVQTQRVNVAPETYVDEDRATAQPEVEAAIEGARLSAEEISAGQVRLTRPETVQLAGALTSGANEAALWSLNGQPVWFPADAALGEAHVSALAAEAAPALGEPAVVVAGLRLSNGVLVARTVRPATSTDFSGPEPVMLATATGKDWIGPTPVVPDVSLGVAPALLHAPDASAHIIYESRGLIYHASRRFGGSWTQPQKIAKGGSPAAVFDTTGHLHVAFVNEFMGNYDIYHVEMSDGSWTLPGNISATSGQSVDPSLVADSAGKVYVAWMDSTSGPWAIHTGEFDGSFWTSYPVSNARGGSPSIAVFPDGHLFLAWQDRVPQVTNPWGVYNIYGSEGFGGNWELPVNISDNAAFSPGAESIGAAAVVGADNHAHLGWIDNERQLRYDFGRGLYWPPPVNLGPRQSLASGLAMRVSGDNLLFVAWDNGDDALLASAPLGAQSWPPPELLPLLPGKTTNVALTFSRYGLAAAWLQKADAGTVAIYEARRAGEPVILKSYLPLLLGE